ncbi:MAG: DUF748 domain-containing protein [Opitutaceae bacterium]|nr:DUF748 domain-containing protein [Opitutaceae bacterium]
MKPSSRLKRWLVAFAALLVVFTVVGFFVLPPIIKAQAEKRLAAELGRTVRIGQVAVNPYALSLTIEDFSILEKDGTTPFIGWRRVHVDFAALASLRGEWVLSELTLDGFDGRVAINADQTLNFSDILAKLTAESAPASSPSPTGPKADNAKPRPLRVAKLQVNDARLDFSDATRATKFATILGPVTFTTTDLRMPSASGAPYGFEAVTEAGEKLAWSGTLHTEPVASTGEFAIENIVLKKYAPYYAELAQADLTDGKLTLRGRYEVSLAAGQRTLKLAGGSVQLRGLKLLERRTQAEAVALPALDITGINADAIALKASIDSLAVSGGHVRVRREKNSALNLLAMLAPPVDTAQAARKSVAPPSAPPSTPSPKPEFTLRSLAVKDVRLEFSDLAVPRPAQLALEGVQVALQNLTLAEGAKMPAQVAFGLSPSGSVKIEGDIGLFPLTANLRIAVEKIGFAAAAPYVEQFVNARLADGEVTTTLIAQLALSEGAPPTATVAGDVRVERLAVLDARNAELAGFRSLNLRGLRISNARETAVALEEVALEAPYARVVVLEDQTLNLATLARSAPAAPAAGTPSPTAPSPDTPAAKIEIGQVTISGGDFRFTDRSLQPGAGLSLRDLGGTITGLSSVNPTKGDLDLKATVDGTGPVAISGKLDPLGVVKKVDLKVDFKNVDLLPLGAYSGKFAGYELARGKLALDVKLHVDGPVIAASNVLTLRQFTFGSAVQSPEATKLPVRLAVALLKDLDGNIVIDVPIEGRTDDPEFRIGRVVWRVIGNLLVKVATSPFALLGAAFGGGGDELAFQDFGAGSSEIGAGELKKLATMTTALKNRPGLSLSLEGSFDTAADTHALKRVKLDAMVRRALWETKRKADPNLPPPDRFTATAEELAATTKRLFDEKFPPGSQFGTPLPAPPPPVEPPPAPQGFFQRLISTITQEESRQRAAAEKKNAELAAEHQRAVAAVTSAGLPLAEMTGRLAEAVVVGPEDLRALALARAQRVRDYFITQGGIAAERIFLAKATENAQPEGKGPRVFLELQ